MIFSFQSLVKILSILKGEKGKEGYSFFQTFDSSSQASICFLERTCRALDGLKDMTAIVLLTSERSCEESRL